LAIPTLEFGSTGHRSTRLIFGGAGLAEVDQDTADRVLTQLLDHGVNHLDVAAGYGDAELRVAPWLRTHRDEFFLATKTGERTSAEARAELEKSLRRLGVDHVDLWYLHRRDPQVPIEETVGAMALAVEAGKVRYLGLSEVSGETARAAHAVHPITAVQSEWSLWTRDPETGVLPTLRELGIGFVPFSPLGRGFLTGQLTSPDDFEPDDMRRGLPRFSGENFQRNLDLVAKVRSLAEDKGVSASQLALAWLLAQGNDVAPIPGTKRRKYLAENLGAVDVSLTADELAALDAAFPPDAVAGDRYAPSGMKQVGK
jgi:aryl-alcohol dehydrogenase-like predicted oxidoreductase